MSYFGGGGGGGVVAPVVKRAEIDFGPTPTYFASFVIDDSDVTPTSKISVSHAGEAATNRSKDENEMDHIQFNAFPGAGFFGLNAATYPSDGPVSGKYRIYYLVSL